MKEAIKRGRPVDAGKLEQILAVATKQFGDRGYRAVTMREVAKLANVSSRTLYKHYSDKLSLFNACMDLGSHAFPVFDISAGGDIRERLIHFSTAFIAHISVAINQRAYILVHREGPDFPGIRSAAKYQYDTYFLQPLVKILRTAGLEEKRTTKKASLFLKMLASEWAARVMFGEPAMSSKETANYIALVTDIFLNGVQRQSK